MATVPVTTAPLTAPGGVLEGLGSNEPKQMGRGQLANTKHNLVYNILAVLVPPLAVGLKTGDGCEAIINVALLFCGFFPGVIHAMFVVNTDMRLNVCTSELALTNAPGANMLERAEQAVVTPPATARPPVAVGGPLSKAGGLEGPPTSPAVTDPKAA